MNKDILKGQWLQIKGKIKQHWAKLTDDELSQIEGKEDELIGILQKKYGYSKDQAKREFNNFMSRDN